MKPVMRFFGIALAAACAVTAIPVAVASAAEETKILPEPTAAAPLSVTTTQAAEGHLLTVGGFEVKCKASSGSEAFTTANNGKAEVILTGCTGPLSTTCSSGTTAGLIKAAGSVFFWLALFMTGELTTELVSALVFHLEEVKFTCVNAKKTVEDNVVVFPGCIAAEVLARSLNKLIETATQEFAEFKSGQTVILEVLPAGATKEELCLPTVSVNGGAAELAALRAVVVAEKFKKGGLGITIELMK
jgi:hypothetical protein